MSPKKGSYGNIQHEFPFFGYGQFIGEGLIPHFSLIVTIL